MKRFQTIGAMVGRAGMLCRRAFSLFHLFTFSLFLFSCSMIDEDQSDCEVSAPAEVDYDLQLVTNMTTEIQTQLSAQTTFRLAESLRTHLSEIFSDYAHDVDLSFYDTVDDSVRLQHDRHIMDANQASYTLNLPMHEYMHLAVANIVENDLVGLANDEYCHPSKLQQVDRDTIESHGTGIFTARLPMDVLEGVSQSFNVHLYMANCAACLVIDPQGNDVSGVKVFSTGFATGFNICDSAFVYPQQSPIVRTILLSKKEESDEVGFCSVTFPSPEPKEQKSGRTRTVIETEEPFIAEPGEESLWEFRVYVPQPDGTVTETVLRIREPLRAGQLKIIKVRLRADGSVDPETPEVGASVTLDWKPGSELNPGV
ncbi:MAG: hypothetical protein J6X07_03125 [Prevotella sp.]|nr:hypothetical protein [Prevotella sp.]